MTLFTSIKYIKPAQRDEEAGEYTMPREGAVAQLQYLRKLAYIVFFASLAFYVAYSCLRTVSVESSLHISNEADNDIHQLTEKRIHSAGGERFLELEFLTSFTFLSAPRYVDVASVKVVLDDHVGGTHYAASYPGRGPLSASSGFPVLRWKEDDLALVFPVRTVLPQDHPSFTPCLHNATVTLPGRLTVTFDTGLFPSEASKLVDLRISCEH